MRPVDSVSKALRGERILNGYQYILTKQVEWAKNRDIVLIGSKRDRGRPSYVAELEENLFQPLLDDVRDAFMLGDGTELGPPGTPGMRCPKCR
jgi:hypothetical protein